jgi:hypothetical protein
MKLSELTPCAFCGGPLIAPPWKHWQVLAGAIALLKPDAAREVLGLTQVLNGALSIAEALAPVPDAVAVVERVEKVHICMKCWTGEEFDRVRESFVAAGARRPYL